MLAGYVDRVDLFKWGKRLRCRVNLTLVEVKAPAQCKGSGNDAAATMLRITGLLLVTDYLNSAQLVR